MSGSSSLFASVIVPVRNGDRTVRKCLAALVRSTHDSMDHEIVVVDNGSTDETAEIVREFPVRRIFEARRGLSHARNRGIRESRGEAIAFIDADCYVTTRWLAELLEGLRDPSIAAVTGEVLAFPPATAAERYAAIRKPHWQMSTRLGRERPWFLFGNAAVRRQVFDRLGLFDPRFRGGAEDIDFAWRFFDAGFRVEHRPKAIAFHEHRRTALALFRQHRGYGRNQAILCGKYPDRLPWGWRREVDAWKDLIVTARSAFVSNDLASPIGSVEYLRMDLIRKLAQRLGFLEGRLMACVPRRFGGEGATS